MRPPLILLLACLAAAPARARSAGHGEPPATAPPEDDRSVDRVIRRAHQAWQAGQWSQVRQLLEPLAADETILSDKVRRTQVLPLLADATLSDESVAKEVRVEVAAGYLDALLDRDPDWSMPQGVYSPELYRLFIDRTKERDRTRAARCRAERNACRADLAHIRRTYDALEAEHARLEKRFLDQEVEIRKVVKRSRVFALIPFGVGHFYNGLVGRKGAVSRRERTNLALGGTFLVLEAATGAAGLGLLLQRIYGFKCKRTAGFDRGSVRCQTEISNQDAVERTRKAEEVMGWMFLGSVALDIVLAQIRFEPVSTAEIQRVPRRALDSQGEPAKPKRRRPRATIRPGATLSPQGAGIVLRGRF